MNPELSPSARIHDPVLVALALGVMPLHHVDSSRQEQLRSRVLAATEPTTGVIHAGDEYFPGDFMLAEPGAKHAPFDAPNGALLLIRSGLVPRLGWLARTVLHLLRR